MKLSSTLSKLLALSLCFATLSQAQTHYTKTLGGCTVDISATADDKLVI